QREAGGFGDALDNGATRGWQVYLELTSQKIPGIEIAQHNVGVRHRRLGTPIAVTNRPRLRTCRFWPHFQQPQRVDTRYRATASANLDHLDYRQFDGQT